MGSNSCGAVGERDCGNVFDEKVSLKEWEME